MTMADDISVIAATPNLYFLPKNLFCACASTMPVCRMPTIDATRAIHVRADELFAKLLELHAGDVRCEAVEVLKCGTAEHLQTGAKQSAPGRVCETDRIFCD
jgi:hypothetical protein